jgi:hypothetical protein
MMPTWSNPIGVRLTKSIEIAHGDNFLEQEYKVKMSEECIYFIKAYSCPLSNSEVQYRSRT